MNRIRAFFSSRDNIYSLIVIGIVGILAVTQHISGSRLMGWDHLQTELHPWLAVNRAYFSIWQEYQSFGLLAGMAHGSDLVRAFLTGLLLLVMPTNDVRLAQYMIMLAIGGIGMLRFLRLHLREKSAHVLPLLGALFYMFNFGTIQIFHMPFEPFSYFFASLPWLMYVAHRYVCNSAINTWKELFWIVLINFLATPSYYIQTLFVVYVVVLGLYMSGGIVSRAFKDRLKKALILGCMIGIVNAFWLIPQIYFVAQHTDVVMHAKINQLATEDVSFQNKEAGTLLNLVTLRGYYTSLGDSKNVPIFQPWITHFDGLLGKIGLYGLAGILVIGIVSPDSRKKYFLGPLFFLSILLLSDTPIISELHSSLMKHSLIHQMFRSPFTKLVVAHSFVMSYFFIKGSDVLLRRISYSRISVILLTTLILLASLPAFQGNFFARDMQVVLPQDYLDTIEYFKTVDPNQRIALLPDATFWGWFYTDWGYNGSGFLWYGIEQPIVSRTFDVWSESSESYFWEMKRAVESERIADVENVLNKYAIDYIILDHSLKPVAGGYESLQYDALANMLSQSPRMTQFGKGTHLSLYRYHRPAYAPSGGFTQLAPNMPVVEPATMFAQYDDAYQKNGLYRSAMSDTEVPDAVYPFRNLTSATKLFDDEWALTETPDSFVLIGRIPGTFSLQGMTLTPSAQTEDEATPLYEVDTATRTVTATIAKKLVTTARPSSAQLYPCSSSSNTQAENNNTTTSQQALRLDSRGGFHVCAGLDLPHLDQRNGYLFSVTARNIAGRPLFMSITDSTKKQSLIEDRLTTTSTPQLFMIPPHFEYGLGYIMTFQNTSYTHAEAVNRLEAVNVYEFPFETIARLHLQKRDQLPPTPSLPYKDDISTNKRAYHAYTVDITHAGLKDNEFLILNQSYHPGWKAYIVPRDGYSQYIPWIVGKKIPESNHVRINSWAQGWKLPDTCEKARGDCRIVLLFPMHYATPLGLGMWLVLMCTTLYAIKREHGKIVK